MASEEPPKVVPPRNDFKNGPVFVRGTIADQAGARPGYRRQWFVAGDDESSRRHPLHVSRRLRETYVGARLEDGTMGHCRAEAWTHVHFADAKPGRTGDATGKQGGVTTELRNGDLVCLETPEENAAIWDKALQLNNDHYARRLGMPDSETITDANGKPVAGVRSRIARGDVSNANDVLNARS